MLDTIRAALIAVHPIAPYGFLAFCLWFGAYGVRRWLPSLWLPLTLWPDRESPVAHVIQALPTTVVGAAWAGFTTGGEPLEFVFGAVSGAAAPIWHHFLKALPIAYRGPLNDAAARIWQSLKRASRGLLVLSVLLVALPSCGGANRPAAHHVETGAAMAYTSAAIALELLDAVQAEHLASLEAPTDAELATAETLVRRLELARDALAVVECTLAPKRCRPHLQPAKDFRGPLRDGLRLLRQAMDTESVRVPPRATEALRVAESWLGGDGES